MLVEALVRSGKEDRAKELLPQILARDPSFLEGRLTLARILADGGDRDAAIDLLRAAPKDEEGDPDTEYLLASELYRRAAGGATRGRPSSRTSPRPARWSTPSCRRSRRICARSTCAR